MIRSRTDLKKSLLQPYKELGQGSVGDYYAGTDTHFFIEELR